MRLKELIERHKECNNCMKTANYPQEWLDDMSSRKKAVFAEFYDKADRIREVDAIHAEYTVKFDNEGRTVKIPYNGSLITLIEAEELLAQETTNVIVKVDSELFIKNRKQVQESKAFLNSTDWYLVRKIETGEEVPTEVVTARVEARVRINELSDRGIT